MAAILTAKLNKPYANQILECSFKKYPLTFKKNPVLSANIYIKETNHKKNILFSKIFIRKDYKFILFRTEYKWYSLIVN